MTEHRNVTDAMSVLAALGLPRAQQNRRTALCLLALLDLTPEKTWAAAGAPLVGITPMMDFSRRHYGTDYAPNTRETFRRFSVHQLVQAGIALYNPDRPERPVNSPKAVYQIEPHALALLRTFGSRAWRRRLKQYLAGRQTLAERYARERDQRMVPVQIGPGEAIHLTPGEHSELAKKIIEDFAPRFVPGGRLVYVGDTGDKWGHFDGDLLQDLGVTLDAHGKMPDVVLYCPVKHWIVLVEAVASHGPVNAKRHHELARLFGSCKAGLVYVTAFSSRADMARHLPEIAWETEVWLAESPSHLIHFNGERFLGPY
jgi:hypothetical protein